MNIEEAKAMALEMQRQDILIYRLGHIVGSRCQINRWDDFAFTICGFYVRPHDGMPSHKVRYWLDRLVVAGMITKHQYRKGGAARYRFPREVCDRLADEAGEHWKAVGYSETEVRPEVKP